MAPVMTNESVAVRALTQPPVLSKLLTLFDDGVAGQAALALLRVHPRIAGVLTSRVAAFAGLLSVNVNRMEPELGAEQAFLQGCKLAAAYQATVQASVLSLAHQLHTTGGVHGVPGDALPLLTSLDVRIPAIFGNMHESMEILLGRARSLSVTLPQRAFLPTSGQVPVELAQNARSLQYSLMPLGASPEGRVAPFPRTVDGLSQLTGLRTLHVANWGAGTEGECSIHHVFDANAGLREVTLHNCVLDAKSAASLAKLRELSDLNLTRVDFGDGACDALFHSDRSRLRTLRLRMMGVPLRSAEPLHLPWLREFELDSGNVPMGAFGVLLASLQQCAQLKSLVLSRVAATGYRTNAMVQMLGGLVGLRTMALEQLKLRTKCIDALVQFAATRRSLERLNVTGCSLGAGLHELLRRKHPELHVTYDEQELLAPQRQDDPVSEDCTE